MQLRLLSVAAIAVFSAGAEAQSNARCSTTVTRGSRGVPCPAGFECIITDPGHPEYDAPNSGFCQAAEALQCPPADGSCAGVPSRAPNRVCPDGSMGGPVCADVAGTCTWTVRQCPPTGPPPPPAGPTADCISWNDGCNTCAVMGGSIGGCTKMFCKMQGTPFCATYADGHTCSNPSCTRTVTNTAGQTITVGVAVAHHSGGLASLSQGNPECWSGDYNYARCCVDGDRECWGGTYTSAFCCAAAATAPTPTPTRGTPMACPASCSRLSRSACSALNGRCCSWDSSLADGLGMCWTSGH